jgi:DHA2 family multidrug resistance protein
MAIWGVGVMVGPVLGPTLGGYLTDIANWRWTFYINVPIGIASLLLAMAVVPETAKKQRQMDWLGLALISIAIGATQYFLDRGNQEDWLSSTAICIAILLSILGLVGFCIYNLKPHSKMVFDVAIFKDRNFTIASLLLALFGLAVYGGMVILPILMENLLNYPVLTTGWAMAPRGISGMIGMMLVGKLIKTVDPRYIAAFGILLSALGTWLTLQYNLMINLWWIVWPQLIQGFGVGLVFVPLAAIAFSTLPDRMKAEAAGIFSLLRTIGSSIGISVIILIFTRHSQIAWNQLGGNINPYNMAVQNYLSPLHLTVYQPQGAAVLAELLSQQAQMQAILDDFAFITWSLLIMLPFILLLKKAKNTQSSAALE